MRDEGEGAVDGAGIILFVRVGRAPLRELLCARRWMSTLAIVEIVDRLIGKANYTLPFCRSPRIVLFALILQPGRRRYPAHSREHSARQECFTHGSLLGRSPCK